MATPLHNMAHQLQARHGPLELEFPALAETGVQWAVEINQTLQTTLELHKVIELFSREVDRLIPHDGIEYHNPTRDLSVVVGRRARNACSYRLVIDDESYGELVFRRGRKFSDRDTILFEYLLCSLLYPLRNALLYTDAVALAQRDALTGIHNRSAMDESLLREIELAKRHGSELSLIVLDIDRFKTINDAYGHTCGDTVIKAVVKCAQGCIRSTDVMFRYGGEEFVVLLRSTDLPGARLLADRIRDKVSRLQCTHNGQSVAVTVSAGVTSLRGGDDPTALFGRADAALYVAKENGRNLVEQA